MISGIDQQALKRAVLDLKSRRKVQKLSIKWQQSHSWGNERGVFTFN